MYIDLRDDDPFSQHLRAYCRRSEDHDKCEDREAPYDGSEDKITDADGNEVRLHVIADYISTERGMERIDVS